ncbi:MAG: hypothetical protein ACI867_001228 [Glaciecola sp.]
MTPPPSTASEAPEPARDAPARERARRLKAERDEARRKLTGVKARLVAAEAALDELSAQRDEARSERDTAQQALSTAAAEQAKAVAREQRRQLAQLASLRDEVAGLRRAEQDRGQSAKAAQASRARAAQDRQASAVAGREQQRQKRSGGASLAAAGRPSELPPDVQVGTTAHAKALLAPERRILVDGYNVAKTVRRDLPDEAAQRAWLEAACRTLAASRRVVIEVFWDGQGGSSSAARRDRLVVHFSPAHMDADDDIVFAVEAAESNEPLVIVTDDRGLRERLAPYLVDLLGTQSFGWALRG